MKVRKHLLLFRGPLLFSPRDDVGIFYEGSQHFFILIISKFPAAIVLIASGKILYQLQSN